MAGLDASIYGNQQAPQQISLGDMLNIAKGAQAYKQAQQINPLAVQQQQAATETQQLQLANTQNQIAGGALTGLENSPSFKVGDAKGIKKELEATEKWLKTVNPNLLKEGGVVDQAHQYIDNNDIEGYKNHLANVRNSLATASEKYAANLPKTYTNTAGQVINVKPLEGTAEVIGQQGVPANLTMGEVNLFNKDLAQTREDNASAQPKIATLQTIKNLSKDAFTGVGGGVKTFTAGLAQSLGVPAYVLETANTQELAKNSAILQLAGGNTDLALRIAEIANPHSGMNQKAINDVVNQLSGIERMKQARAQYLLQEQNNPVKYNDKSQRFNAISDPRIFQDLTPEEAQEQANRMSASEKKELLSKIRMARLMGVIPNASQQSQQNPVEVPR
jgi:hypothetical protein